MTSVGPVIGATTVDRISWDTSPFFLSVLTCLSDTPSPPINVDCYVLLVAAKFSKCNFYLNIDWERGGTNDKVRISQDVHFDIEEDYG